MNIRGFLRSTEGVFPLSPKITIVGRESCDFTIQNLTVDLQHAVIEYLENEDCFVLKDLNSTHGSYVNECRIQNATVRLNDGDVLKFGFSAGQYEFHVEHMDLIVSDLSNPLPPPSINTQSFQKTPWMPVTNSVAQVTASQITSFPLINYSHPQSIQHRHTIASGGITSWTQISKPPQSGRSVRPLSASSLNRRQLTPSAPSPSQSNVTFSRRGSISGPAKQFQSDSRVQPSEDQKLVHFQVDTDKVKAMENELADKSAQIGNLIQQNSELLDFLNESKASEAHSQIQNLTELVESKENEISRLQSFLGSLSENFNRHNTNYSNNESEINQIRQELDIIKRDLKISNGLVTALQKDLSTRDESINKLTRDNQTLAQELSEKNVSITVLMNKLSKLKDIQEDETEKQDRERELVTIRSKLSSSEAMIQEQTEKIEILSQSLEKLQETDKISTDALRDLNKQLDDTKSLVTDLERSESLARVDIKEIEKKHEQFRNRIIQVALSTPGVKSDRSITDDGLIDIFKNIVKSNVEHDSRLCERQKLCDEANKKKQEMQESINSFKEKLTECYAFLDSGERTSNRIAETISLFKSITVITELLPLKEIIITNMQNEMQFLSSLESCISISGHELTNLSISECFKRMVDRCMDAVENRNLAEDKLLETLESYEEKMERLRQMQQEEMELHSQKLLEIERQESEKKYQQIMDEISDEEDKKRKDIIKSFDSKILQYEENIEELRTILEEKEKQAQVHLEKLDIQTKCCDDAMNRIVQIEQDLKEMTEKKITLEQSICEQFETINGKWKAEIEMYKEETAQHAITIDLLNNRLMKLNKENMDHKNQLIKAKTDKKKSKKAESVNTEIDEKQKFQENESALHYATVANLEKCISALRHENVLFKNKISEYEGTIKGLNMDLAGAEARLSDLKGELSESQKNEIDNLKIEVQKLEEECLNLRVQMAKLSGIIDALNQDLDNKKVENNQILQNLAETKAIVVERECRINDLEFQIKQEKESLIRSLNRIEQEGRVVNELATFGSQCRGERHQHIIESQKIALSELRKKIKTLEATKIPNSTVPEITQQMLEMKRELAALRSKKALRDGAPQGMKSLIDVIALKEKAKRPVLAITDVERRVENKNEQGKLDQMEQEKLIKKLQFDLEYEKSQFLDSQQNLDYSEMSYLNLLRQIASALEIEDIRGLRTFKDLLSDERDALRLDREEACGFVIQKIKILKERIQRKEELLQSYEQDLVKLKQAEDLATKAQLQLENFVQQMRNKGEEVELLRETLNRTKDLLNEEKRTNTAIKKHKFYIPQKTPTDGKPVSTSPKLHCPTEDSVIKEKMAEKQKSEKNKRKDYEIKSLKAELYRKEKELSHANNRLYSLETSMGIKSEEPVS